MVIKKVGKTDKKKIAEKEVQSGVLDISIPKAPPIGYVTIAMQKGVTINMGNYQSARLDVFIARNVPDDENLNKCYDEIADLLDDRLITEVEKIEENQGE